MGLVRIPIVQRERSRLGQSQRLAQVRQCGAQRGSRLARHSLCSLSPYKTTSLLGATELNTYLSLQYSFLNLENVLCFHVFKILLDSMVPNV